MMSAMSRHPRLPHVCGRLGAAPALLALLLAPSTATAQEPAVPVQAEGWRQPRSVQPWDHAASDIPVDGRIVFGSLDNGMRYAWAHNPKPEERVYLRLHIDAGSFAEGETELGLAHFLEHMAFNGTENFEAGTLIEWFQGHGMSFGADTNAHTAFSETVYKLDLPHNDEATLKDGMLVLRDFASGMLLAEEEVQAEKGVIDGEERERDSAGFRNFVQVLERQYAGTRLPDRLPIGKEEVRAEFTAAGVRAFYERWYRPENATLVIVGDLGDFNPTALIEAHFADWESPGTPVEPEPAMGEPTLEDLLFAVYDEEIPAMSVEIAKLKPYVDRPDTVAQRQADLARAVAYAMVNLRFSESLRKEETPYVSASVGQAGGLKVFEGGSLSVAANPEQWEEGMKAAYVELRRALNYGFQEAELEEIRANLRRSLDEAVEREATASSAVLREGILAAVEEGGVPSDAATDRDILLPALEALTAEACRDALREDWRGGTLSIIATGKVELAEDKATLMRLYEEAKAVKIERPADIAVADFAYASDPAAAGEVVRQELVEDLDFWQVQFANGVRLNVKKTDFKERQVLMHVRLGHGLSAIPDEHVVAASMASFAYDAGGLEAHSMDELRRITAGRQVGVGMGVQDDQFSVGGATTPDDLLFQFELACAAIEHPGYREEGMTQFKTVLPLIFNQFEVTPAGPMYFDFAPAVLEGDLRASILGLTWFPPREVMEALGMEDIRAALSDPMAGAPMEVTVVGDVDVNQVVAAAAQTFGALSARRAAAVPERRATLKTGVEVRREIPTADQKATLMMLFPADDGFDAVRRRNLSFLGQVLNDRLRLKVREELGAAYSPGAGAEASTTFRGLGGLVIQANGSPEGVEDLIEACRGVAQDLATAGVTAEEVERLAEPLLNQLRDAQRTNGYWLGALDHAQGDPQSLQDLRTLMDHYGSLKVEDLSALAEAYLKPERASMLVVLPQVDEANDG